MFLIQHMQKSAMALLNGLRPIFYAFYFFLLWKKKQGILGLKMTQIILFQLTQKQPTSNKFSFNFKMTCRQQMSQQQSFQGAM